MVASVADDSDIVVGSGMEVASGLGVAEDVHDASRMAVSARQ